MAKALALYLRISRDRTGRVEGCARQEKWGRAYAAEHPDLSHLPVRVYQDNDLTAADDDVYRPDYERLRKDVAAGEIAAIWAVEQYRLERREVGWFVLAAELDAAGIEVVHTNRDGIVRVQDDVAGIKAVLGAGEVRRMKKRINDTLADLADEGRPPGGASWGYEHVVVDGRKALQIIPAQAEVARWAASAVLSGWSLASVVRKLEADGVATRRGGRWTTTTVKSMLTSPTIAGKRVYKGEVLRNGNWDPILDEDTWLQVCARLNEPRTVSRGGEPWMVTGRRRPARRYLLTGGTAVCGKCGAALIAQRRIDRRRSEGEAVDGLPMYLCHSSRGGCNGIGIVAVPLEEHVRDLLLEWLDTDEFQAAVASDDHRARRDAIAKKLAVVEARRRRLAGRWADGELDDGEWDTARASLVAQRARLEGELARVPAPAHDDIDVAQLARAWAHMDLGERREVVGRHIASVTVLPAKLGTRGFDPDRVRVRFVGQAD